MGLQKEVTTSFYIKHRVTLNDLKALKEDANRILVSNKEGNKIFSPSMERLAYKILKDIEAYNKGRKEDTI